MNWRQQILSYVTANPGCTSLQIYDELMRHSKAAKWWGAGSLLTALFGPSLGRLYVTLAQMEADQLIWSKQGTPTAERGWRAPRFYFLTDRHGG